MLYAGGGVGAGGSSFCFETQQPTSFFLGGGVKGFKFC